MPERDVERVRRGVLGKGDPDSPASLAFPPGPLSDRQARDAHRDYSGVIRGGHRVTASIPPTA